MEQHMTMTLKSTPGYGPGALKHIGLTDIKLGLCQIVLSLWG